MPAPQDDPGRRRRSGNPAVRAGAVPPPSPARSGLERRSRPWLVRLAAIPRWILLVLLVALAIAGLLLPGWIGAVILLLIAVLAVWLTVLSWPVLRPGARVLRVVIVALLAIDIGLKIARG